MAIFNLKYLEEVYKSKYAEFLDDDDDEYDDSKNDKDKSSNPSKKIEHLDKHEIARLSNIIRLTIDNFPKLKKCCDYIDLSDKENINDDGERESAFDKYYNNDSKEFIQLINGEVLSGYPDLRTNGSSEYDKDCREFVKLVNEEFTKRGIKAKFMIGPNNKDDEAINFGVKSMKEK